MGHLLRAVAGFTLLACAAPAVLAVGGEYRVLGGCRVLSVEGSPRELGLQHGTLLREEVQRVVRAVVDEGEGGAGLERLLRGAMVMERYLPLEYREELRGLAEAAEVDYSKLVALQLFGDVARADTAAAGFACTSYAAFGPATATGELIAGRNMDYWDHGVTEYGAILLHVRPDRGNEFVTCSWAGIINGWTALSARGIVCSNNSAYGAEDSLEGLSTCFMVRKVAQYASTLAEGVEIVRRTPRACGTSLLIASGDEPAAAIVEYDHREVHPRHARDGWVAADNTFQVLGCGEGGRAPSSYSRAGTLAGLIKASYGRIDRTLNFAAAPGVPIRSMNLHSALVFPADRQVWVSLGPAPAADQPYHGFQLTPDGLKPLGSRVDAPALE